MKTAISKPRSLLGAGEGSVEVIICKHPLWDDLIAPALCGGFSFVKKI